jgi:hypothetical protein
MANQRIPSDPYRPQSDPYQPIDDNRPIFAGDDLRSPARLDSELQVDPELAEGPATGGRIAMFAVAIALVMGAVFYGLNSTSIHEATTAPPTTTAQNSNTQTPAAPPGMRDVTPRANNTDAGVTTGAAPARPQSPPSAAPTGQDVNRSGNPPMNNPGAAK